MHSANMKNKCKFSSPHMLLFYSLVKDYLRKICGFLFLKISIYRCKVFIRTTYIVTVSLGMGIQTSLISAQPSHQVLVALIKLRNASISLIMSVCLSIPPLAWKNSAPAGRIVVKLDVRLLFENLS